MSSNCPIFPDAEHSPKIVRDGKEVEEHQFLNVGLGIHPEVIVLFLRDNGIRFKLSDY